MSAANGALTVESRKLTALASFSYTLPGPLDISNCPAARVTLMAEKDVMLCVTLRDADGQIDSVNSVVNHEIVANGRFNTLSLDFSKLRQINLSRVTEIVFVVNRSADTCNAALHIREIALGGKSGAAPGITAVTDQQIYINGPPQTVSLHGIYPAIPGVPLTLKVSKYDSALVKVDSLEYGGGDTASLKWSPSPDSYGSGEIVLALAAEGCPYITEAVIGVTVERNAPPSADPVPDIYLVAGKPSRYVLTGLDDGNRYAKYKISIKAESSLPEALPAPAVRYAYGPDDTEPDAAGTYDRWATLMFEPVKNARGAVQITLDLKHDGGTAAGGSDSSRMSFNACIVGSENEIPENNALAQNAGDGGPAENVIKSFEDDFSGSAPAPEWTRSGEGCHFVSYDNGALRIDVDKSITNNVWAGLWFQSWDLLDLSEAPFISVRMKTDKPMTEMTIFLWDQDDVYNTAQTIRTRVSGEFTDYFFDFTDQLASAGGGKVDLKRIKSLLINFAPGKMFTGTFWFKDFKVGGAVDASSIPARLSLNVPEDHIIPVNAPAQFIKLTGIKDGKGNRSRITAEASCDVPGLLENMSVSPITGGEAVLSFAPVKGAAGDAVITVTVSSPGADDYSVSFKLSVVLREDCETAAVSINTGAAFQTIDGFGAFVGSGSVSGAVQDLYVKYANDIGMSMARIGVIDAEFEPANVNSNIWATDYGRYNTGALPLDLIKRLSAETNIEKFVLTMWSPPSWMKLNKSLSAINSAYDNRLAPWYYEAYAGHLAAIVKTIKEKTGVSVYAVSPQNEPQFNEPYASAILFADDYVELVKIIGRRFREEGLKTKIFMPEALPEQKGIKGYIDAVNNDLEARQYVEITAIHNYDGDGVNVGGAGTKDWRDIYGWSSAAPAKNLWMTETSGHENSRAGAMALAGNIHNALTAGNINAWLWWSFGDTAASEAYGLLVDGAPTSRYFASKQYYKFIQPGDVRVEAVSSSAHILATAFTGEGGKVTVVLINGGRSPYYVTLTGKDLPEGLEIYMTSPNKDFEAQADNGGIFMPPDSIVTAKGAARD